MPEIASGWVFDPQAETAVLDRAATQERIELNSISAMILAYCDGKHSVRQIIDTLCLQYPDAEEAIPGDVEEVLRQLQQQDALRFTPAQAQQVFAIPDKSPDNETRQKLCIGMATYDDYDGVYFSVQAIRLYHPEVLDQLEILVIDNHPDGPCAQALKNLGQWIPRYRYIPSIDIRGTAVRDVIFREANADYVLCIDSHVMIEAGAIQRLLDYFEADPKSRDLLQGPLINDDLVHLSSHFSPGWRQGMYGTWGYDERAADRDAEAFDIPMQGLGLFACRKEAWPGFNPRFSGFGGEEGYIHEKVRQGGGRTLCLPFLRWIHRFVRPMGTRYEVNWHDRIRNYMIGFSELGLPKEEMIAHFRQHVGQRETDRILERVRSELSDPLFVFDALFCVFDSDHAEKMLEVQKYLEFHPAMQRMEYLDIRELADEPGGVYRRLLRELAERGTRGGYRNLLLIRADRFEGFPAPEALAKLLGEVEQQAWQALCLDRGCQQPVLLSVSDSARPGLLDDLGALAVHSRAYAQLLAPQTTD